MTLPRLFISLLILGTLTLVVNERRALVVWADEYDELTQEKEEKIAEKEALAKEAEEAAVQQKSLSEQLTYYQQELTNTRGTLRQKEALLQQVTKEKEEKEGILTQKIGSIEGLVRSLYKVTGMSPLELYLGSESFTQLATGSKYYEILHGEGQRQAKEISSFVASLAKTIEEQETLKQQLAAEAAQLSSRTVYYDKQVQDVTAYLSDVTDQIGEVEEDIENISARQEELIREKLAATSVFTSVGEYEEATQSLPNPGFSPAFAVFSGGYPHRIGMSQYGAYGRAKAGQSAEEILHAYYADIDIVEQEVPEEIEVTGSVNESLPFEDVYLKGIAEMPSSWADDGGFEALKAQAIAARTYALAYTNNGAGSICDNQNCQVFLTSKAESSSAAKWHEAVEETRGMVMLHGGSPIKAWYASTAGGYTRLPTDFDVKWNSTPGYIKRIVDVDDSGVPYEGSSYGDSPWFRKAWYAPSDGHPWLSGDELADLCNAALLPSSYNEHLSQEENGGWSAEEVREALAEEGITPVESVTGASASYSGEGYSNLVRVTHGGGTTDIDGKRFREIFILRSRGHLALWSSLYDIVER